MDDLQSPFRRRLLVAGLFPGLQRWFEPLEAKPDSYTAWFEAARMDNVKLCNDLLARGFDTNSPTWIEAANNACDQHREGLGLVHEQRASLASPVIESPGSLEVHWQEQQDGPTDETPREGPKTHEGAERRV